MTSSWGRKDGGRGNQGWPHFPFLSQGLAKFSNFGGPESNSFAGCVGLVTTTQLSCCHVKVVVDDR